MQVSLASELLDEFLCLHWGAPLSVRDYYSESVEYQGRELDVDHDYTEYECGYSVVDGKPQNPCEANSVENKSTITST